MFVAFWFVSLGDVRIEHERAHDVSNTVADPHSGGVSALLTVPGDVGCSEGDALDPGRGEEVDEVQADDTASAHRVGQLPPGIYLVSFLFSQYKSGFGNSQETAAQDDRQA